MINVPPSVPATGAYFVPTRSTVPEGLPVGTGSWLPDGGALAADEPVGLSDGVPVPHAPTTSAAAPSIPSNRCRI
jgi:hypothetical protein